MSEWRKQGQREFEKIEIRDICESDEGLADHSRVREENQGEDEKD